MTAIGEVSSELADKMIKAMLTGSTDTKTLLEGKQHYYNAVENYVNGKESEIVKKLRKYFINKEKNYGRSKSK